MDKKIQIKEPCPEEWDTMVPAGGGRFCDLCCKKVFDFTKLTDAEIARVFRKNKSVCARIPAHKNTVTPVVIKPDVLFSIRTTYQNLVRIVIVLIFLNLTISCQDATGSSVEKPVLLAEPEPQMLTGIAIAPPEFRTDASNAVMQNGAYLVVDTMPEFKGGRDSMMSFVQSHLRYPVEKKNEEAKIFVSFIINEQGKVIQPRIEHKSCENSQPFEKEVLRMLKKMPGWEPGKLNGRKVPVKMVLPVNFKL